MVVVREKTTVTQRIHGNCPTHSRTEIAVRDVRTVIDEPKEREGTNMGPTPTETMVAALIACTNVISHKCEHGIALKAMTIDAESTLDRRGTQLLEEIEVPFRPGKGEGRSASLLPDFQGGSQFGHGA
jgi:putative redox protein